MAREQRPLVAVIMGSDSDLPVMAEASRVLEKLGVPCETTVVATFHRVPGRVGVTSTSLRQIPEL